MNTGTKIRTIARAIVSANTAIYAVSASVTGLGFNKLTLAWLILTIASDLAVAFVTTYFNNDFTPIAAEYTGAMRLAKDQSNGIIHGEDFFDDVDEDLADDGDLDDGEGEDIDDGPDDGGDEDGEC